MKTQEEDMQTEFRTSQIGEGANLTVDRRLIGKP
jgi:hypothetical protein